MAAGEMVADAAEPSAAIQAKQPAVAFWLLTQLNRVAIDRDCCRLWTAAAAPRRVSLFSS
jgi:hypothetical protein